MQIDADNGGVKQPKGKADARALALKPAIASAMAAGAKGLADTAARLAARLNEQNIPTTQGDHWRTETVRRTMLRLSALGHMEFAVRSRGQARRDYYNAGRKRKALAEAAAVVRNAEQRAKLRAAGLLG